MGKRNPYNQRNLQIGTSRFDLATENRGDPILVGRFFGHTFNPPRDDTKYVQYTPERVPLISYDHFYMQRRMLRYGSEMFQFDKDAQISNAQEAFGWTLEQIRGVFFHDNEEQAALAREHA